MDQNLGLTILATTTGLAGIVLLAVYIVREHRANSKREN